MNGNGYRQWVFWTGFLLLLLLAGCRLGGDRPALPAEKKRLLANVLYNQQLYQQAVEEYRDYLLHYPLSEEEQASVSFQIARIYFEKLHRYEDALAYYLRIKHLYPNSSVAQEASRQVVACLERLQRSAEARQLMQQTAALSEAQKPNARPEEILARIGQRTITRADLEAELRRLPPLVQEQFSTPERKKAFLREYIAQELLYDSALRQGLDRDPEVREGLLRAQKALMAQKLLEAELKKAFHPEQYSQADVELYYQAHKERYAERNEDGKILRLPPFEEVAEQVAQDFFQEKQQQAYQQLLERLMKAENVVIYDERIR